MKSLAEAYAHGDIAWPRLIVDGDQLVGFQQGRGYGRCAVEPVCAGGEVVGELLL